MEKDKLKQREIWIDVLRAFACICVVLIHSSAKYDGHIPGQFILAPANYVLMATGVCIFYMISGSLLLSKEQELFSFYRKRFTRILFPVIIWSIFYIIYESVYFDRFSWDKVFHNILMIPFVQQTGLMWFMYVLAGIYLAVPILSSWLTKASKKEVEMILAFWCITLMVPFFKLFDSNCELIIGSGGSLYYFSGFLGYALLGYYLRTYVNWKITGRKFISLFTFSILFPLIVFFTPIPLDLLNGSMNFPTVCLSTSCFLFFKTVNYDKWKFIKLIQFISKYSFGVYLSHWLFILPIKYTLTQYHINYLIQMPCTAFIILTISLCCVVLLSKLPFSKYIIG